MDIDGYLILYSIHLFSYMYRSYLLPAYKKSLGLGYDLLQLLPPSTEQ